MRFDGYSMEKLRVHAIFSNAVLKKTYVLLLFRPRPNNLFKNGLYVFVGIIRKLKLFLLENYNSIIFIIRNFSLFLFY